MWVDLKYLNNNINDLGFIAIFRKTYIMNYLLKSVTKFLLLAITLCSFIFYIDPNFYKMLAKEDGLIENITATCLLIISLFLLYRLIRLWSSKNTNWIILNILIILGFFFGFGEEISWGQRIFQIESNSYFLEYNLQGETNLHNLKLYGLKINMIVFTYVFGIVYSFYLFLSTFLFKKYQSVKNLVTKYGIPLPTIQHSIVFIIASIIITTVPSSRRWELWECFNSLLILLIFIQPFNLSETLLTTKNSN
jgi:hypothetical protein